MKKIDHTIKQVQKTIESVQPYLKDKSFAAYKEDYIKQGKILTGLKQAKEQCYDLGMEIVKQQGWKEPDTLEELFYLLQEQAVIDSDLVDQMIAMYRFRGGLIEDNLEKGDYNLVDEIIRQNLADVKLYLKQVKEYKRAREITEFRSTTNIN